jgi:hypothetical protein
MGFMYCLARVTDESMSALRRNVSAMSSLPLSFTSPVAASMAPNRMVIENKHLTDIGA